MRRGRLACLVGLALIWAVGCARAASFDCAKASTPDERLICANDQLGSDDSKLNEIYGQLRQALDQSDRQNLRDSQRRWIDERNRACGVSRTTRIDASNIEELTRCFRERYGERIAKLSSDLKATQPRPPAIAVVPPRPPVASAPAPAARFRPPPGAVKSSGTGFFVSADGLLLTNSHVVDGCISLRVSVPPDRAAEAVTVAIDRRNDLALLRTDLTGVDPVIFRPSPGVRQGEDIVVYGFPLYPLLSPSGAITKGSVSALSGVGNDSRLIQLSAPVQPGNSGGPVIDTRGNVVGVVVSKLSVKAVLAATGALPENVNFAIKSDAALAFLSASGASASVGALTVERRTDELAEAARNYTALIECYGVGGSR